jgi:flagellar basal-body rod protein FlgF
MDAAMYKALSGAVAQMRRLEVTTQDLANVNTSGYKGQRLAFREVLAQGVPPEERPGGWVAVGDQRTRLSPGEIHTTANPFNLALETDGFFVVQTARGERYTRNGSFTLRSDGTVITPDGNALLGEGGPIQVAGGRMEVAADGSVRSEEGDVGRIRVVRFADSGQAVKEGASLFRSAPGNVELAPDVRVLQGSLEQSNVSPIDGMVSLISLNRQFEAYERAMKLMDSVTERLLSDGAR